MLKYIGDFDKLKDYGFHARGYFKNYYKKIDSDEWLECEIKIGGEDRSIRLSNEQHEINYWINNLDTLYDLIKDGLVIKDLGDTK